MTDNNQEDTMDDDTYMAEHHPSGAAFVWGAGILVFWTVVGLIIYFGFIQ
jgi:hypothetical protein